MAICTCCGAYYKTTKFNQSTKCEDCLGFADADFTDLDEEDKIDLEVLLNPSHKTPARFLDE